MDGDDQAAPQPLLTCPSCPGCVARDRIIAQRDQTIADQAKVNERITSELRWHGLDEGALTVAEAFAMYSAAMEGHKSWRCYEQRLRPVVRLLGALPCLQVNAERWAAHRAIRTKEKGGRYGRALPSSTQLDHELGMAKMMFLWLVRNDKLPRNPLETVRKRNEPSARETYLEAVDVQRLIDGADVLASDPRGTKHERRVLLFRGWVAYKFGCFLRLEESRGLRRDQIGTDGVVELSAKRTKSKRKRTVVMPAHVLEAVRAIPPLRAEPYVFSVERAGRVSVVGATTLRGWFYAVCAATGVDSKAFEGEKVVPHVIRHSAASHAEAMGAHPVDIQAALGHASLATTEKYLHRRPAQRAMRIAELMGQRPAQRANTD